MGSHICCASLGLGHVQKLGCQGFLCLEIQSCCDLMGVCDYLALSFALLSDWAFLASFSCSACASLQEQL